MIRTLYTTNRSLNVVQKRLENTGSNIGNVKTPGYKFQGLVQSTLANEDMINYQDGRKINRFQGLGPFTFGNQIDEAYTDFLQGGLQETTEETDFAISGEGFFTLRLGDGGVGYTRNGNFRLDEGNRLVSMEGYPVLGRGPGGGLAEIVLPPGEVKVDNTGTIEGTGLKFNIVEFADPNNLEKMGDTIFLGAGTQVENATVVQGYVEMSNVHMADEMVKMIEVSREFESNQKFVQTADEMLAKTVNEIGKVW